MSINKTETRDQRSATHIEIQQGEATCEVLTGLPAYNEEVGIGSVILACQQHVDEVVVVDDGSKDMTASLAQEAGATVIKHATNRGKGAAVKTLFEYTRSMSPEVLVMLDADGQHSAEDIPKVMEPVLNGDADIVIGSRYLEDGDGDETPLYRRFGQQVLDYLTLGRRSNEFTDTQSGFRAFSPRAVEELELTTDQMGIETEMLDSALRSGLKVVEVPISVRYKNIDGQTYNPLRHGMIVAGFVLSLIRDRHPMLFFGVPGLLLLLGGGLYGTQTLLSYTTTGGLSLVSVLVSGLMTIIGTLALFVGMTLQAITRKLYQLD
jgi:glycosyltransferase involved in cell wall biosynthesis